MKSDLKFMGIWLPANEKRRIKVAAATRDLTLNAAVRQAIQAWIGASPAEPTPPAAGPPSSAPAEGAQRGSKASPPGLPSRRRAAGDTASPRAAKGNTASHSPPPPPLSKGQPGRSSQAAAVGREGQGKPASSAPATARQSPSATATASAPAYTGGPWDWLRGAPALDWSACPAVEAATTARGERVWVLRGTHVTLKKLFRLVEDGRPSAEVNRRFGLDPQAVKQVLRFAAERLAPFPVDE